MARKFVSVLFLIVSLSIGLGALGHGSQWIRHVSPQLDGVEPRVFQLLEVIWYWVSGTMLAYGVLLVWIWRSLQRGERNLACVPWTVAVLYLVAGTWAALWLGPFFWVFTVQALLLGTCTWMLTREPARGYC